LIDGTHLYESVKSDTGNALKLLKPGGVIVWDDYGQHWPDVIKAVDETGLPVVQIRPTGLAVYASPSD
jgi:hypothetical protein